MKLTLVLCLVLTGCSGSLSNHPIPENEMYSPKEVVRKVIDPLEEYYCLAPKLRDLANNQWAKPITVTPDSSMAAQMGDRFLWYVKGAHDYCYGFGKTLPDAVDQALQQCTQQFEWKKAIPLYEAELAKQREMCLMPEKKK